MSRYGVSLSLSLSLSLSRAEVWSLGWRSSCRVVRSEIDWALGVIGEQKQENKNRLKCPAAGSLGGTDACCPKPCRLKRKSVMCRGENSSVNSSVRGLDLIVSDGCIQAALFASLDSTTSSLGRGVLKIDIVHLGGPFLARPSSIGFEVSVRKIQRG